MISEIPSLDERWSACRLVWRSRDGRDREVLVASF